jgi:hypothetical protein
VQRENTRRGIANLNIISKNYCILKENWLLLILCVSSAAGKKENGVFLSWSL